MQDQIKPGTYKAKIINYALKERDNGNQYVQVTFGTEDKQNINWFGNVSEQSMEYTLRDLFKMGANKDNFTHIKSGLASGVLNTEKIFEIVVVENVYNGKVSTKIKYINDPSAPKVSAVPATNKLENFKGVAFQIAAETGQNQAVSKKMEDCPGF